MVWYWEFIFEESHYEFLPGGILESFATLFSRKVKLFVYPTLHDESIYSCAEFKLPSHLEPLFQYLVRNDKIEDIRNFNELNLHISTDRVLEMIQLGEDGWESMVPDSVVEQIKASCLFGYPCEVQYTPIGEQVRQQVEQINE